MSSSNHDSVLRFDDHSDNFPKYVPRRLRSTLQQQQPQPKQALLQHQSLNPKKMNLGRRSNPPEKKTKPTCKTRGNSSSNNEGESKEIPTLTKILMGTCLAAILSPQITTHTMSTKFEIIFQWVGLLSMMVGMYVQSKRPKLSMWLQSIGHLNCLVGLMVMQGPILQLPLTYVWIPPFVVVLILGTAMFLQS